MRGDHRIISFYLQRQVPARERLTALLALSPAPLRATFAEKVALLSPADQDEALSLAGYLAPFSDRPRRELVARLSAAARP